MAEVNEFQSDAHRRVCGNLGQPRSIDDLAAFLRKHDPYVSQAHDPAVAAEIVKDLEADGLVKKLPSVDDGKALVSAIKSDDDLVTLHSEKAKLLADRVAHPKKSPFVEDTLYIQTARAVDRFNADVPDLPPPLSDEELARREAANDQLAAADAEMEANRDE